MNTTYDVPKASVFCDVVEVLKSQVTPFIRNIVVVLCKILFKISYLFLIIGPYARPRVRRWQGRTALLHRALERYSESRLSSLPFIKHYNSLFSRSLVLFTVVRWRRRRSTILKSACTAVQTFLWSLIASAAPAKKFSYLRTGKMSY